VYVMKANSEAIAKFKIWKALVENKSDKSLKILRSNSGGEYVFEDFFEFGKHYSI